LSTLIDPAWEKDLKWTATILHPGDEFPALAGEPVVCVDVETRPRPEHRDRPKAGLDPWRAELLGFAIGTPGRTFYVPLRHRAPGSNEGNVDATQALAWLQGIVNQAKLLVNQHLKFDLKHLAQAGLDLTFLEQCDVWDTMLASQVLDERWETHSLKPVCEKVLGLPADEQRTLEPHIGRQPKDKKDFSVVPIDIGGAYACGDVQRPLRLAAWQWPRLKAEGLLPILALEHDTLKVDLLSELRGVAVDLALLEEDKARLHDDSLACESEISACLGGIVMNPDSPDDCRDAVENKLGLPILKWTPKKEPQFDDAAILEYIRDYPEHTRFFWNLRKARRYHHLRSGFVEPYLTWQTEGVIHTTFNQLGARTGRKSSSDPNLQQVPKREKWKNPLADGAAVVMPGARQYFVPRPGYSFLSFDYSQIEYRLFAHYANSPRLLEAYRENPDLDMHQWAADTILEGMLPRSAAKNVNFGLLYGMGERKLLRHMSTEDVKIPDEKAKEILVRYYAAVPELRDLQWATADRLRSRGYIKTILGRRRRAAKNMNPSPEERGKDRGLLPYQALNALCQGSAADLLKDRAVAAAQAVRQFGGYLLLTIHDELVFEVPKERVEEAAAALRPILETFNDANGTPRVRVPIYVNASVTETRWSESKELVAA
jgi:DNA polymerase-1